MTLGLNLPNTLALNEDLVWVIVVGVFMLISWIANLVKQIREQAQKKSNPRPTAGLDGRSGMGGDDEGIDENQPTLLRERPGESMKRETDLDELIARRRRQLQQQQSAPPSAPTRRPPASPPASPPATPPANRPVNRPANRPENRPAGRPSQRPNNLTVQEAQQREAAKREYARRAAALKQQSATSQQSTPLPSSPSAKPTRPARLPQTPTPPPSTAPRPAPAQPASARAPSHRHVESDWAHAPEKAQAPRRVTLPSGRSLREAIVLKTILDRPVGLQPPDSEVWQRL